MPKPTHCPNPNCTCHDHPVDKFYIKKGYYTTKHNHQPVPRYQCKFCKKYFSSHTFSDTYKQKKPELNNIIWKFYSSNVSLNRLAINLECNRKTVVRKFLFLAYKSRRIHEQKLKEGTFPVTKYLQFDEMETYEHTRKKPLSIALAVRMYFDKDGTIRAGEIIDAIVATMNCKGWLAAKSRELYGEREDTRDEARNEVMESVKKACQGKRVIIGTDGKTDYPPVIKKVLPDSDIRVFTRKQVANTEYDPLFVLNHTCALIRHDLSRMARKSWVNTKKADRLQAHLDLYIAYKNGYNIMSNH